MVDSQEHNTERKSLTRVRGKVIRWFDDKRFGFIEADGYDQDIYVNYKSILVHGPKELYVGEPVEFALGEGSKGPEAHNVRVFESRFWLERFADIRKFSEGHLVDQLADMSGEDWGFRNTTSKVSHPVLRNYVLYTCERLLEEDKIIFSDDKSGRRVACGNLGLATDLQQEIFAYFQEHGPRGSDNWVLEDFLLSVDKRLSCFTTLPDVANYFDEPTDLLFDVRKELRVNYDHIVKDNWRRFPVGLQSNIHILQQVLETSVKSAERRVKRNYKAAIPQYFKRRLQLLLPICLNDPGKADMALVVSREGQVYIGSTVLPLDAAYNNARLIARPDREWLQP